MAKYYVESGSFRGIVDAIDSEMASVWAIDRVMGDRSVRDEPGLFQMGDDIRTSERGFGRRDAEEIPTRHAFLRWAQFLDAAEKMAKAQPQK